jgi:hypothetical protein
MNFLSQRTRRGTAMDSNCSLKDGFRPFNWMAFTSKNDLHLLLLYVCFKF